ncbi:MAG: hypothetical protein SF051_04695 [Elusimicrobiota bacterium]|nr:hypothetical protein [Elusimicrobiota bacterium]
MTSRLRSLICALALCIWGLDIGVDAFGRCEESKSVATACHVCACANHFYNPSETDKALRIDRPQPSYPSYQQPVYSLLLIESIFQPPKLTA